MTDFAASNPFTIRNHRLFSNEEPVPFLRSPNQSAGFAPQGLVLHDTAGRLNKGSTAAWFQRSDARASAHLTVERDGSIIQQVGFDRRAWHAGKSCYNGRSNVNGFAFGIEIVNLGKCAKLRDGAFQPWFKGAYYDGTDGLSFAFGASKAHGKGWWLDYSAAQIRTVTALCLALTDKYALSFIAGHWEISPGRKIDPNPLFPLAALRQTLFGEEDNANEQRLLVDANLRRWPSFADNVIAVLNKGTQVEIIRSGKYETLGSSQLWHLVEAGAQQGWLQGDLISD